MSGHCWGVGSDGGVGSDEWAFLATSGDGEWGLV